MKTGSHPRRYQRNPAPLQRPNDAYAHVSDDEKAAALDAAIEYEDGVPAGDKEMMTMAKNAKTAAADDWVEYQGGTWGGSRPVVGEWVSIGRAGTLSISAALAAGLTATKYLRLWYSASRRRLRLMETEGNTAGALRVGPRGGKHGQTVRVSAVGGLRGWGIQPAQRMRYAAAWVDGGIEVDLACVLDTGTPRQTPAAKPAPGGVVLTATCPECMQQVPARPSGRGHRFYDHADPDGLPCVNSKLGPAPAGA
jgi:hypothetical protein